MYSRLRPDFVYDDISGDVTETDIDVVSDLWSMDGRNVYRGSRDPRYTHANVYWLYDEDLQRVGCSEHDTQDHAVFHLLWFEANEFATLLQEPWTAARDLWGTLPQRTFERFLNEGWTDPHSILEHCLHGPTRIVTPEIVRARPLVYSCSTCGRKSLSPLKNCLGSTSAPLDIPSRSSVVFVDSDLGTYLPPPDSSVWVRLGLQSDASPLLPAQEQEPPQSVGSSQTPPLSAPLHPGPPQSELQESGREETVVQP